MSSLKYLIPCSPDLKLKPVIIESSYNMAEVCCVGLVRETGIVMKNPNPISVQVETSVSDIKVDGMIGDPGVIQVKRKFHLRANECKSLKVIDFVAKWFQVVASKM